MHNLILWNNMKWCYYLQNGNYSWARAQAPPTGVSAQMDLSKFVFVIVDVVNLSQYSNGT
jgi:hypothetical protein